MISFLIAAALRRARHREAHDGITVRGGTPAWRLLGGEARHLAGSFLLTPRGVVVLCGVVAASGVLTALGPGYPGPVAPTGLRWTLAATVAISAAGLAPTAPRRWSEVRRTVRRARIGLAAVLAAAAVSVLEVGLHEVTPGPVLPGPVRWAAVSIVVLAGVTLAAGRDRTSGSS